MDSVNKEDDNQLAKPRDLSSCRACLATDDKLFNMHEYTLVGEFFRVTGIIVLQSDKLPQHLCVWCAALMKRCAAFRAKCLRGEQCLQLLEGELTTDSVRNVDRLANQLVDQNQTETEVISVEGSVIPVHLVPIPIANLNNSRSEVRTVVKEELYMEIENITEIKNDNIHNIKHESDFMHIEQHDICNDEIFGNISNTAFKSESNEPTKNVKKDVTVKTRKRNAKTSTAEVKTKRQRKKKIENPEDTAEGKRSKKCKKRTAEDKPNINMEEFKKACDVDILILTHEEQVAEMEARRATEKYKAALYRCQPCGKHFRTEEVLQHHNAKHAVEAGPHECPVCATRHHCKSTQMRHSDIHRFKFVCRPCGFVSRTRTQAKLHHAFHAGKKYPCEHCGKEFNKRTTWLGHLRQTHKALNVACDMCGETFVNASGLKCHKVLTHGVATQKEFKTMECKICEVTFISLDALKKHKMAAGEHDKRSACAQCGDCFDSEDTLREHVEAEHPSCKECNSTFVNLESYNVHVERKHLGKGSGDYAKRREANRRARARGRPLPYPPPAPPRHAGGGQNKNTNKDTYKVCCELCGKIVSNSTNLEYHLRKHRGEKMPHACDRCPKSFYIKQQLEQHMRVHTGEKPFQCARCDLAFTLKSNLERHVRVVHEGIRRTTQCPICGRHLATPFTMKMHVRTVHNGEPWPKRAPREKRKKQLE